MNKEIEEIARIICVTRSDIWNTCEECLEYNNMTRCYCHEYAEALINEGYHKMIWHKVADGDLPKENKKYLVLTSNGEPEVDSWLNISWVYSYDVIAWKEIILPNNIIILSIPIVFLLQIFIYYYILSLFKQHITLFLNFLQQFLNY